MVLNETIDMDTIHKWAQEQDEYTGELHYLIETPAYSINIHRDNNMVWSYGVGVKSKYLSKFVCSSKAYYVRGEMARELLHNLAQLDMEVEMNKTMYSSGVPHD